MKKKIVFITATRADYGKLKSIIKAVQLNKKFKTKIFVTGMHNLRFYGNTVNLLKKDRIKSLVKFGNQKKNDSMENIVAKTINGFSNFINRWKPDLIVTHGDRVEPLACAIVGCLSNTLVAHIEGGEVSGTVDEILRHSISKLSHLHFVSNNLAKKRLLQLGELEKNIFIIGSPDIDILLYIKKNFLYKVQKHYGLKFNKYSIVLFHPVVTLKNNQNYLHAKKLVDTLLETKNNYIVIFPNNDKGSQEILRAYKKIKNHRRFKIFSSLRFEYFLSLLQNSDFIIGNSSAGVREAPYYGIPTINLGFRQNKRSLSKSVINLNFEKKKILKIIRHINKNNVKFKKRREFGGGKAYKKFIKIINNKKFWDTPKQKYFKDLKLI